MWTSYRTEVLTKFSKCFQNPDIYFRKSYFKIKFDIKSNAAVLAICVLAVHYVLFDIQHGKGKIKDKSISFGK